MSTKDGELYFWLAGLGILLIAAIAFFVVRKLKHNNFNVFSSPDPSSWIAIVIAIIALLVFLAATGHLPWPTLS